jgi:hypothetical protein
MMGGMAGELEALELADVVAFLACHVRGDQDGCRALLEAVPDGTVLLGHAISMALEAAYGALPGGRAEFLDVLTGWQERYRGTL